MREFYVSILKQSRADDLADIDDVDDNDLELPAHPERLIDCVDIGDGLRVPAFILEKLFPYQRRGMSWMWDLHRQRTGGILADEMGTAAMNGRSDSS